MSATSARTRRVVGLTAGPLAIVLAGVFVWQASTAAFTATTRNSGNAWTTGHLALTDDDLGSAAITITDMIPMQTGTKCIVVTSSSNIAGELRMYFANLAPSSVGIEDYILVDSQVGSGGTFNDCTGFVPSEAAEPGVPISVGAAAAHDYATGFSEWITTGTPGESRTFKFTWTFDTSALTQQQIDSLQGGTLSVDAIWELQSA